MEDADAGTSLPQQQKSRKFVKPTLQEVQMYCEDRTNGIDASKFIDYYDSVGWKIGKAPMKDWKAAIRSWEHNKQKTINNNNDKRIDPRFNFDGGAKGSYFTGYEDTI